MTRRSMEVSRETLAHFTRFRQECSPGRRVKLLRESSGLSFLTRRELAEMYRADLEDRSSALGVPQRRFEEPRT